jgi:hypothetical protein
VIPNFSQQIIVSPLDLLSVLSSSSSVLMRYIL